MIAMGTNLIHSCKLCITIQPDMLPVWPSCASRGIRGLLESYEVIDGLNGAAVVLGVGTARLVHQGDNERPTERPGQVILFFSWHHSNEHTHVISIFTISAFRKDKDAVFVPIISTHLHHWTFNCLYASTHGVSKVHVEVIYFPQNIVLTRRGPARIQCFSWMA